MVPRVRAVALTVEKPEGYRIESTPTYPTYPYYPYWGYYSYAPMFIDLIFAMLFLTLPLLIIIPIFKSLTSALTS